MKLITQKFNIGIVVFIIGILLSVLALLIPDTRILVWGILTVSLIYLTLGWYIFKGYYPEGHAFLLFLMGYLYSGVFIALVFSITGWPLAITFITVAPVWALIQFAIIFSIRKKISQKALIQFIIEACILLLLDIILIIRIL